LKKPWAVAEIQATKAKVIPHCQKNKTGFVLYHILVVTRHWKQGFADREKRPKNCFWPTGAKNNPEPVWGFVTGIDRRWTAANWGWYLFSGSAKSSPYTGRGWNDFADSVASRFAENKYGNPDQLLDTWSGLTPKLWFCLTKVRLWGFSGLRAVYPSLGHVQFCSALITQFFGIKPWMAGNPSNL